jgi:hypothetical protein
MAIRATGPRERSLASKICNHTFKARGFTTPCPEAKHLLCCKRSSSVFCTRARTATVSSALRGRADKGVATDAGGSLRETQGLGFPGFRV